MRPLGVPSGSLWRASRRAPSSPGRTPTHSSGRRPPGCCQGDRGAPSVARSARRALAEGASGGRLALRLLGEKARGVALSLVRRLRGDGFRAVHVASGPDGAVVVTCRLHAPLPGRHPAR